MNTFSTLPLVLVQVVRPWQQWTERFISCVEITNWAFYGFAAFAFVKFKEQIKTVWNIKSCRTSNFRASSLKSTWKVESFSEPSNQGVRRPEIGLLQAASLGATLGHALPDWFYLFGLLQQNKHKRARSVHASHRVLPGFPPGGTDLPMLISVLERLDQSQRLIYGPPHRKVVHCDLAKDSFCVDNEQTAEEINTLKLTRNKSFSFFI